MRLWTRGFKRTLASSPDSAVSVLPTPGGPCKRITFPLPVARSADETGYDSRLAKYLLAFTGDEVIKLC